MNMLVGMLDQKPWTVGREVHFFHKPNGDLIPSQVVNIMALRHSQGEMKANFAFFGSERCCGFELSRQVKRGETGHITADNMAGTPSLHWEWTKKQRKHKLKPMLGLTSNVVQKVEPGHWQPLRQASAPPRAKLQFYVLLRSEAFCHRPSQNTRTRLIA